MPRKALNRSLPLQIAIAKLWDRQDVLYRQRHRGEFPGEARRKSTFREVVGIGIPARA